MATQPAEVHVLLPDLFSKDLVTISVGTGEDQQEFTVHKALLCSRSSFFDTAFNGSFQEATTNTVELREESPEIFKCFLHWLYTSRLPEVNELTPEWEMSQESVVLQLFALGDKLFVPDMQDLCWTWLREYFGTSLFPDPDFINELYTLTEETSRLRKYFVQICGYMIAEKKDVRMSWDDLLDSSETFAADVAKNLTKRMRSSRPTQNLHPYTENIWVRFRKDTSTQVSQSQSAKIIEALITRVKELAYDVNDSRTFADWPHREPSKQAMIAAGWILKPTIESGADRVTCHFCSKSTFNWKPDHDPLERHRFWSPRCPFVMAVDAGVLAH